MRTSRNELLGGENVQFGGQVSSSKLINISYLICYISIPVRFLMTYICNCVLCRLGKMTEEIRSRLDTPLLYSNKRPPTTITTPGVLTPSQKTNAPPMEGDYRASQRVRESHNTVSKSYLLYPIESRRLGSDKRTGQCWELVWKNSCDI